MSLRRSAAGRQRGLSLIEFTIALSIAVIVIGTAIPSFQRMLMRRLVEGRATELRGDLLYARSEAISRNTSVQLSVKQLNGGACYVLHTGKAADCSCANGAPASCSKTAQEIKTVLIPASDSLSLEATKSISFDSARGTASLGTITLTGMDRQAISIVVNKTGRVRSCTPKDPLPGIESCSAASR